MKGVRQRAQLHRRKGLSQEVMQALPGGRVLIVQGQLTHPRLAQSPGDGAADAAATGEQRLLTCRLKTLRVGGELKANTVQHIAL